MPKERISRVILTEEDKRKAFTKGQLGEALYAKLRGDPNFALMSIFCTNAGIIFSRKIQALDPERGRFRPREIWFDNMMCAWDFDEIALVHKQGHKDEYHQMLFAEVPFIDGTDRAMSALLCYGTRQELIDYMNTTQFGPRLMAVLDELNDGVVHHD